MTQTNARALFITGIKNAHAMENQALSIMKPQISRIENYPDVARRLEQHIKETEGQIARLEDILSRVGEDSSTFKDWALSMSGGMAALAHTAASDEILKNTLANYAFEHFEIAAYKSLLALAELGEITTACPALEANLKEEEDMAEWLDANIRGVTLHFATLSEAGEKAKV
jgi:ferritin-like metal-binding protein YciE